MTFAAIATALFVSALLVSVLLGWAADLRQVRHTSARENRREYEERIRDAYFSKERRMREMRERLRRERRQRSPAQARSARSRAEPHDTPEAQPAAFPEETRHRITLELSGGPLTPETVRRHYKRLVRAYHPDRVAGLGLKLQKLAEEETKRINEAYAYFRKRLNF